MPRVSYFNMLPEAEQQICLRRLEYLQTILNTNRHHPVLQQFNRRMAAELNVTESTISQVVSGRNKNPELIQHLYDHVAGIFGGDSTANTFTAVTRRKDAATDDPNAQLLARVLTIREREKELASKFVMLQNLAREMWPEYQTIRNAWEEIDRKLPDLGDTEAWLRLSTENERLVDASGGGGKLDRIKFDNYAQGIFAGVADVEMHRTNMDDYQREIEQQNEVVRQAAAAAGVI